jgi:hypothetical protein
MGPLLANPDLKPAPEHIQDALDHFSGMLTIRKSSPLFRLQTADQIKQRVQFHNTGLDQIPGLIVMSIDDRVGENLDPGAEYIVVLFNATDSAWSFELDEDFSSPMLLHPILAEAADEITRSSAHQDGIFYVPAMTTAVFVAVEEVAAEETPVDLGREVNDDQTPFVILALAGIAALGVWLLQKTGEKKDEYLRIGDKF